MQLSRTRPFSRYGDRFPLRFKLVAFLSLVGVLLTLLVYWLLGLAYESRLDARVDDRANELVTLIGPALTEGTSTLDAVETAVRLDDIHSIAIASVDEPALIAETAPGGSAGAVLSQIIRDGQFPSGSNSVEIRPLVVGSPLSGDGTERYLVAVEVDRAAVSADLAEGRTVALATLIAGLSVLLIVSYFVINSRVSKPLSRLATLDAGLFPSHSRAANGHVSADEITRVRDAIAELIDGARAVSGTGSTAAVITSDTLPEVWLQLDIDMNVFEARLDGPDGEALDLEHLGDLLSGEVVEYTAATARLLEPGEEETFEFSLGAKVYLVRLIAEADYLTLSVVEGTSDHQGVVDPSVAAAEILSDLLGELPVSLIEMDERGVVRYANRPFFGARSINEMVDRAFGEILPEDVAESGRQAMRAARKTNAPQAFEIPADDYSSSPGWTSHVVAAETEDGISYFVLSIEREVETRSVESPSIDVSALEEQLWGLELKVSEYENEIAALSTALEESHQSVQNNTKISEAIVEGLATPMTELVQSARTLGTSDVPKQSRSAADSVRSAVLSLAGVIDEQFGTNYRSQATTTSTPTIERFHLATLLDEVAIEAGARNPKLGSRISAFVQPSLPKWLLGNEYESRVAIHQMIELARLVCAERPLILAAMQETSSGRSIQVRFEVQIPPPVLDEDEMSILRGCIRGDMTDGELANSLQEVFGDSDAAGYDGLDIEVVTVNEEATVLRCSTNFELAEDVESEHSWVRGLRTLIIQGPDSEDNGIQSALSAFGVIGYVVTSEKDLIDALRIAEEYSNPYRFVIADVDTPNLESFVGQLFEGDAPVVLVGTRSESAMVGAISAGYNGYVAKPVRQVDLLEVILSTVEPPTSMETQANAA